MTEIRKPDVRPGGDELAAWFGSPRGDQLIRAETGLVAAALPQLFGRHLLQIGNWGPGDAMIRDSNFAHHAVIGLHRGLGEDAVAAPAELPVQSHCVDAALLPHSLEAATEPHALLREVDRILSPRGHLLLFGFNPVSLWGVANWLRPGHASFPRSMRFYRCARVCDWLSLLNFEVTQVERFSVSGNVAPAAGWQRVQRPLQDAYLIVARKRVIPMTVIRPKWQRDRRSRDLPVIGATEAKIGHREG